MARRVGSNPAFSAIFPICFTPMTGFDDQDNVQAIRCMVVEATLPKCYQSVRMFARAS